MRTKTMRLILMIITILTALGYALFIITRPPLVYDPGLGLFLWVMVLVVVLIAQVFWNKGK